MIDLKRTGMILMSLWCLFSTSPTIGQEVKAPKIGLGEQARYRLIQMLSDELLRQDDEENEVYKVLVDEYSMKSGLTARIVGRSVVYQVVGQEKYESGKDKLKIYVLDAYEGLAHPVPLVVVVTNDVGELVDWQLVCPWSAGFVSCELTNSRLKITTVSSLGDGPRSYYYDMIKNRPVISKVVCDGFDEEVPVRKLSDPKPIKSILAELISDSNWIPPTKHPYAKKGKFYRHNADWNRPPLYRE